MADCSELRRKILDRDLLPFTHQTLNVHKFLEDVNQEFFDRLASQLAPVKRPIPPRSIKSKSVSKLSAENDSKRKPRNSTNPLADRNQFLREEIKKLKQQNSRRQVDESPQLADKQAQIRKKSELVERLSQKSIEIKSVLSGEAQMYDLYQKMCRKCENIRKANNQLSQQLKNCIKRINELTGKDDNPNLFIMNFK